MEIKSGANVDEIMKKYSAKIERQISTTQMPSQQTLSREYEQFKRDMMPNLSRYEKLCQTLGKTIKIKLAEKDNKRIQKWLDVAHLEVSPGQTITFAIMSLFLVFFFGILISLAIYFSTETFPLMFLVLILIASMFLFYYTYSMPQRLANSYRLKASSQMVPAILYTVVYMKHTSNLERAVVFTSQHLAPPLALDFRKIFWDLETGKFSTLKSSLDAYLETWREYAIEFVESFHLIESSLYEPSEIRRVQILERALQVILDGVYEKMLKYSREIRSPLTNIYMLGIVLPTLALALLPLASTLLQGAITWIHVFVLFNLIIPFFVFYLTSEIMLKRPGGHGEAEIIEMSPLYSKYKSKKPYLIAGLICFPLLIIGLLPLIFQYTGFPELLNLEKDYTINFLGSNTSLFDFKTTNEGITGPFGPLALLLSLFVPLSIALFFSISFSMRSREIIKSREDSKQLEEEFASSLFQLGNRLGDGMPAELAFSRVAEQTRGLKTENFFRTVNTNIQQQGMSVEKAIFHPKRGAIIYFPSALIATSMRILVESVKKGLEVAARSLMSISEYVKNIKKINERLRDLLAEVVSDMKSNMTFLAPLLAGIVVGLASMITAILSKLQIMLEFGGDSEIAGLGNISNILEIFDITKMIPPYFLQVAIGIYIIQIIFILTSTLVTVDSGEDKLKQTYDTSVNLRRGVLLYLIVTLVAIVALYMLASFALGGMAAG